MLAIRMQRRGRKGHPIYRIAVQEAQRSPTSGRVVTYLGSYNPHTKDAVINGEKAALYLKNGAQPSPRVVRLLQDAKVALPSWVMVPAPGQKALKHPEKLRKNRPQAEIVEAPKDESAAQQTTEDTSPEASPVEPTAKAETTADETAPSDDQPAPGNVSQETKEK